MDIKSKLAVVGLTMTLIVPAATASHASPAENKKLVQKAMTELFVQRDITAVPKYWGTTYIQHNPKIPNGREGLPDMIKSLPATFKYEPGKIVADGDFVMIHGHYTGWGPKPMVAVDIFRVKAGRLVEHWDVMQDDVPAKETKSGNPMFTPGL